MMRCRHRRLAPLLVLLAAGLVLGVSGCQSGDLVVVDDRALVTWETDGGATAGQIIVSITNAADETVDPDVFSRGAQSSAVLLDADGEPLPGASRIQLHAVPQTLEAHESGYLLAQFEVPSPVADIRVEINADEADARDRLEVTGFTLVDEAAGLGARGRLEWDGSGSGVARAIALDGDGRPLGYVGTSEVRYDAGEFTMCCFPPTVSRAEIEDVAVFGVQALDEN